MYSNALIIYHIYTCIYIYIYIYIFLQDGECERQEHRPRALPGWPVLWLAGTWHARACIYIYIYIYICVYIYIYIERERDGYHVIVHRCMYVCMYVCSGYGSAHQSDCPDMHQHIRTRSHASLNRCTRVYLSVKLSLRSPPGCAAKRR